jgi:glutathione S-transferase
MEFGLVEKRPAFSRYVQNLQSRPAYRRAASLDDAVLAARPPATNG